MKSDEGKYLSESMPVVEVMKAEEEMDELRNQAASCCEVGRMVREVWYSSACFVEAVLKAVESIALQLACDMDAIMSSVRSVCSARSSLSPNLIGFQYKLWCC